MHPTSQQLIEVALAERDAGRTGDPVQEHLAAGCAACQARIEEFREILEAMRSDRTPEPPAAWVSRAVSLRRPAPWADRIRDWCGERAEALGRLVYDSFATPELAGARSVETERRLRLEAAGVELDVRLEPTGSGGRVTGQVLRIGEGAAPLADAAFLVTAGTETAEGTTDDFGEFTVEIADLDGLTLRFLVGDGIAAFHLPGAGSAGD